MRVFYLFILNFKKYIICTILKEFHSGWAYIALVLVVAVVNALMGMFSKKEFTARDRKIAISVVGTHTQLLIGLILYFVSPFGFASLGQMSDKHCD
jgi:CDP-diglyceride synthetase